MQELTLKAVKDGTGSGFTICYLGSSDYRLLPITTAHAGFIWDAIRALANTKGAITVWFSCGEPTPTPTISGGARLEQPPTLHGQMEAVHWKFVDTQEAFCRDCVGLWNTCGGVRIYPAENPEALQETVVPHFFDRSDERRLGMESPSDFVAANDEPTLAGALATAISQAKQFMTKLTDPEFREALMNPFRYESTETLLRRSHAYIQKSGHDEEVCLELLTSISNPLGVIAPFLEKHGLVCQPTEETRKKWG